MGPRGQGVHRLSLGLLFVLLSHLPPLPLLTSFLRHAAAVNQGHCHPKIVGALIEQAQRLTLSSRAFYSSKLGAFAKKITDMFGYDSVLPMNTGAEVSPLPVKGRRLDADADLPFDPSQAVETALKLARKWGYLVKNIPQDEALILSVSGSVCAALPLHPPPPTG